MPENIEIKAHARDPQRQEQLAAAMATGPMETLDQVDTFFPTIGGRLKLRELSAHFGQLIHYHRADMIGPKSSAFSIVETNHPAALRDILTAALGMRGQVRKHRKVYHAGQTRIHLDEVHGLGTFLELEVVLQPGQTSQAAQLIARQIQQQLGIEDKDLIDCAYIDLLQPHRD